MGPKKPDLGIFVLQFNKSYYQIFNQNLWIREIIEFHPKQKKINLGLKMLYLGLWAGMLKKYFHIWNQWPPICLISNFPVIIAMPKLGTKNALFGCFWTGICNIFCYIWYQPPPICLVAKFGAKLKILKFGTKNVWFGFFGLGFKNNAVIF